MTIITRQHVIHLHKAAAFVRPNEIEGTRPNGPKDYGRILFLAIEIIDWFTRLRLEAVGVRPHAPIRTNTCIPVLVGEYNSTHL